jgi:hypothetical protein
VCRAARLRFQSSRPRFQSSHLGCGLRTSSTRLWIIRLGRNRVAICQPDSALLWMPCIQSKMTISKLRGFERGTSIWGLPENCNGQRLASDAGAGQGGSCGVTRGRHRPPRPRPVRSEHRLEPVDIEDFLTRRATRPGRHPRFTINCSFMRSGWRTHASFRLNRPIAEYSRIYPVSSLIFRSTSAIVPFHDHVRSRSGVPPVLRRSEASASRKQASSCAAVCTSLDLR